MAKKPIHKALSQYQDGWISSYNAPIDGYYARLIDNDNLATAYYKNTYRSHIKDSATMFSLTTKHS